MSIVLGYDVKYLCDIMRNKNKEILLNFYSPMPYICSFTAILNNKDKN